MKVLIWFLCLLGASLITTLLAMNGVNLGAIPTILLYVATFALARSLCASVDKKRAEKERELNHQRFDAEDIVSTNDENTVGVKLNSNPELGDDKADIIETAVVTGEVSVPITADCQTEDRSIAQDTAAAVISEKIEVQEGEPAIRFCRFCGYELLPGSAFCSACGKAVEKPIVYCHKCGSEIPPYTKFCHKCGAVCSQK